MALIVVSNGRLLLLCSRLYYCNPDKYGCLSGSQSFLLGRNPVLLKERMVKRQCCRRNLVKKRSCRTISRVIARKTAPQNIFNGILLARNYSLLYSDLLLHTRMRSFRGHGQGDFCERVNCAAMRLLFFMQWLVQQQRLQFNLKIIFCDDND